MIETRIYKCEYCGAEFDDEYEANCHEWVCRYNDVRKKDGSNLRFYKEDGTESKFDNAEFVQDGFDDVEALTIGNDSDVKFIADFFEWHNYDNPFRVIVDKENPDIVTYMPIAYDIHVIKESQVSENAEEEFFLIDQRSAHHSGDSVAQSADTGVAVQ